MKRAKNKRSAQHKAGFPPLLPAHSRVLVLGSMPGVRSLAEQQYYAHPRNLFWSFMAAAAGEIAVPAAYEARKALLEKLQVALWDVCEACIREGSLDTAILEEIPNDIDALLDQYPGIRVVVFNGQKAASLFRKYFRQREGITYLTLASTSPANAGISRDKKEAAWRHVICL